MGWFTDHLHWCSHVKMNYINWSQCAFYQWLQQASQSALLLKNLWKGHFLVADLPLVERETKHLYFQFTFLELCKKERVWALRRNPSLPPASMPHRSVDAGGRVPANEHQAAPLRWHSISDADAAQDIRGQLAQGIPCAQAAQVLVGGGIWVSRRYE